jgi:S-(hydroxymethyl)glutathione dehydrogenase/alcohol dehydrogenase
MKAAILFETKKPFELADIEIDKPAPREVLVRIKACGLCHSDWHCACGDLPSAVPVVLGHEAAGVVEAVGADVTAVKAGDHVVGSALVFCGRCDQCVGGRTHMCTAKPDRRKGEPPRLRIDGRPVAQGMRMAGFAEQMLVHENGLVKIDRDMPLDRASVLGCGVLTGLGAVFNAARVTPGSKVVVLGCGGVGLSAIQGAALSGAEQIVAVDLNPDKKTIAGKFGATDFVVGGSDSVAAVRQLTKGGAHYSFEVIGLPQTIAQAIKMLAPGGLMTIVGATRFDAEIPLPGLGMIMNEWRVQGTYFGSAAFTREIPRYVDMYLKGKLDLDALVSSRIALSQINDGFSDMIAGTVQGRTVITFDGA